jgi:hypothetical protein
MKWHQGNDIWALVVV